MESPKNTPPDADDDRSARRKFLRTVGYAGIITAGAVQMVPAAAQDRAQLNSKLQVQLPATLKTDAKLGSLNRSSLATLKLTQRMPASTNITELGLTPEAVETLTPAAKKLSKEDLVALGNGKLNDATRGLTVQDIGSIRKAFGTGYAPGKVSPGLATSVDVSCCCCTPCCCAAAVNEPRMRKAA